ncbi:MAG: DUF3368 domain-containing protein [Pseudomonadota bacterium]|uniref:DUF3368 domain-containing protein n=1 Tax=Polaromonas sp. TaxID=1869339 RepID=UPI0017D4793D|nr:DUF3368 domain-containing protein [Polaromonas sp.]MBA3593642.1 DUF3368 domain-containing protein [Polaromonas sp.]MDQ3272223.1 DUF3368 domain-containing protein [Pseudomonadota bacterium]
MQLLVTDAGPLIALSVADVLAITLQSFEVLVPQAVLNECLADPYAPGAVPVAEALRQQMFTVVPDESITPLDAAFAAGLGSGEAAVLAYAMQHQQVALIDERRARRIAQRLGVQVVGSGAVLLALKSRGLIRSLQTVLDIWQAHGYYLSPELRAELLERAGE